MSGALYDSKGDASPATHRVTGGPSRPSHVPIQINMDSRTVSESQYLAGRCDPLIAKGQFIRCPALWHE